MEHPDPGLTVTSVKPREPHGILPGLTIDGLTIDGLTIDGLTIDGLTTHLERYKKTPQVKPPGGARRRPTLLAWYPWVICRVPLPS